MEKHSHPGTGLSHLRANPWIFVPMLYFLQGAPYFFINSISVIIFKKLGIPNDTLLFWLGLIAWPWTLKMFWSPVVDSISTKTRWVIATQILNCLAIIAFAFALQAPDPWTWSLVILGIAALISATHDIASDGLYLIALSHQERSFFVGLRSTAYRISRIFVTGALVWLAGTWELDGMPILETWSRALLLGALVYAIGIVIFYFTRPDAKEYTNGPSEKIEWEVFKEYLQQPRLISIIFFILFYRFGESMVGAISQPFLLDSPAAGGLGLSTAEIGKIQGLFGVVALSLGGITGGIVITKFGLRRCLLPMLSSMYVPNLFYLWAAWTHPAPAAVNVIVFVDQFGYGFGFSAYMVFMMFIAQGTRYKTAHYAISSAIMAAGATLASTFSGKLQVGIQDHLGVQWGYAGFFIATFLMCIPGLIVVRSLPLETESKTNVL